MEQTNLSEDLIAEILCRMPVKSVVGFKIVSKTWNNLISNVCIPRILRAPSPVAGFLFISKEGSDDQESMDYFSYSDNQECGNDGKGFAKSLTSLVPSEYFPCTLIDCCNGLILLCSSVSNHRYYVCNPLTKHFVAIPKAREGVLASPPALAFDPRDSSHYKIIRFVNSCMDSEADIFSSETKTWMTCKVSVEPCQPFYLIRSVYSRGGILYSITCLGTIICYNIEALTGFEIINVPEKNYPCGLGVIELCKGALNYANRNQSKLLIWQFDDHHQHNNSHSSNKAAGCTSFWILKHSICMDDWRNLIHPVAEHVFGITRLYILHPNSEIIFLGNDYMMYSYHLKSDKLELVSTTSVGREFILFGRCFWPYSQCCINLSDDFDQSKKKKKILFWRQITACLFK